MIWLLLLLSTQVQGQPDPVAFTYGQTSHVSVIDASTIPFNKEITTHNTGNSVQNGIFTCTVPGLYKFQVYSLTKSNSALFLDVFKNTDIVASLWGHTANDFASAGNAAIVSLQTGDTVQVKSHSNRTVDLYGQTDEIYTTLTGVQLGSLHSVESENGLATFSVALTEDQAVAGGNSVHYNKVLVDTASGYDAATGIYTVPSDGIYIFHFFSLAKLNQAMWQELYHNGDLVCSIYAKTDGDFGYGGNTAIMHLYANDQVTVKAHAGNLNNVYGRPDELYSTFSGSQLMTEDDLSSAQNNVQYAFSVGLSNGYTVSDNGKVVFDRIFIDLNQAYNHVTGEFVAPVSGLYEFTYNILGKQDSTMWVELYHNYHYVNAMYSHTPSHFGTGGNAAVINVDAGDVVYIRANGDNDLYGTSGEVYCTFSGYLLHPKNAPAVIG